MIGSKKNSAVVDHAKLGKEIEKLILIDYIEFLGSTRKQIKGSILRGFFTGLAGVVGATLGVALLLSLLQFLGGAPVIGHYIQNVANSISSGKK